VQLDNQIKNLRKEIKSANSIMQMEELKCRKRVLRRLGFTTATDVIDMKGRVACEISTGDELLLTEMIFNGAFNDLTVDQTCSLLSCFVFEEKVQFLFFSFSLLIAAGTNFFLFFYFFLNRVNSSQN